MPAKAPAAKTTACAASSTPLLVSRTTASTTLVTDAAKRGPRTSTKRWGELMEGPLDGGQGTSGRSETDLSRSDTGSCPGGTDRLCGARSAGCPRRQGNGSRGRPDPRIHERRQFLGSGRSAAPADDRPRPVQIEQGGRPADVEGAHLVEVALGVDVQDGEARAGGLQLLEPGLRRAAGCAERGGELDDGEVGGAGAHAERLEHGVDRGALGGRGGGADG